MWEEIHYTVPETKIDLRWRLEPANRFTKFFWKRILCFVTVDYLTVIRDRQEDVR